MSFFTSPRPRFRYYAVPQQSSTVAGNLLTLGAHRGDHVAQLESSFCELIGRSHAVATPQARIGIYLAVSYLVKDAKKKVVLSPYTIHDVINMVICAGGQPVFADIEPGTCNIAADEIEKLVDDQTAAVLVTHLHGLACDMIRIKNFCQQRGVALIEDSAQALGARVDGKPVGSFGDVGIFSFGRAKNINALFGGMMVTDHADLARFAREKLAEWPYFPTSRLIKQAMICLATNTLFSPPLFPVVLSRLLRYSHMAPLDPFNKIVRGEGNPQRRPEIPKEMLWRMTPMQARLVLQQLPEVDRLTDIRTEYAKVYHDGLAEIPEITIPPWRDDRSHAYLTFPIQVPDRESLLTHMLKGGADVARQYLANNADAECFAEFHRSCPCARATASSTLLLPTYPSYGKQEVAHNVKLIREYFRVGQGSDQSPTVSAGTALSDGNSDRDAALADEADVLFRYVSGRQPDRKMIQLYIYALKSATAAPATLRLPRLTKMFPRLLRLFDPVLSHRSSQDHPFKSRLAVASKIANIGFAPQFYDYQGRRLVHSVAVLVGVILFEAGILPIRLVGGLLWWR